MNIDVLVKAGLTETQAKCYLTLIKHESLTPLELAELTGETRTNSYAVTEKLVAMGLAIKDEASKMKIKAESPLKLKQLLAKRQQNIKSANIDLTAALPSLLSAFCLNNNIHNIINVNGKEAIEMAYDSMISTNQDIFLFSNGYDYKCEPDLLESIRKNAKKLAAAKIKTYILVQSDNYDPDSEIRELQIAKPLPKGIVLDVRIIIFGNNVILSLFKEDNVNSTIISSPEIANSLKSIFFGLWNSNPTDLPGHEDRNIKLPVNN